MNDVYIEEQWPKDWSLWSPKEQQILKRMKTSKEYALLSRLKYNCSLKTLIKVKSLHFMWIVRVDQHWQNKIMMSTGQKIIAVIKLKKHSKELQIIPQNKMMQNSKIFKYIINWLFLCTFKINVISTLHILNTKIKYFWVLMCNRPEVTKNKV